MSTVESSSRRALPPLYLAGFTTAFGAHGVAAALGVESGDLGLGLLTFGLVLALYDLAEVILKPVFGALSDRIGVRPVLLAGLVVFAIASVVAVVSPTPLLLACARLGQGAAASAFSPASSSAVARLAGRERLGRFFGRYGAYKSIGYAAGPLIGAAIVGVSDLRTLYVVLAVLALVAAAWAAFAVPALPVLARPRYTLVDLVRQTTDRSFLIPTLALAATTGVLGLAVGFLPLLGTQGGLDPVLSAGPVAVIAVISAAAQPWVGRRRDAGGIGTRAGVVLALGLAAAGVVVMIAAVPVALYVSAVAIGVAVGVATPLAYAHLASVTPEERMGRTMGNAELGREIGDAGGPLLAGAIGGVAGLPFGLAAVAALTAIAAVVSGIGLSSCQRSAGGS